jgi:hypothetical protein
MIQNPIALLAMTRKSEPNSQIKSGRVLSFSTIDRLEPFKCFGLHTGVTVFFNNDSSWLFEKSLFGRGCAAVGTESWLWSLPVR